MTRLLYPLPLAALAALAHRATAGCIKKPHFDWDSTKYLIAFGDSYTYVQGTAGHANYSFIRDYLDTSFSPETLLTDQIVQNFTGTAEGGPNWVEYLTNCGVEEGLHLPAECRLQLWDFAFAGADISEKYTPLHHDYTIPLVNQTQQYLKYADSVLFPGGVSDTRKRDSLVATWIGINDISDTSKQAADFPSLYENMITIQFSATQTLFDAGFSNFLFVNLPPLDRTPANLKSTTPLPNKTMVAWWGETLARHVDLFEARNQGAKAMLYDANTFLNKVLDHHDDYGIVNTTSFCPAYNQLDVLVDPGKYGCNPLDQYFWYNSGHMTSYVHRIMAPDVANFLLEHSSKS
ncbi:lysophospholipase A [Thozetella sp. PMI_491]|nr:lysophospholipase A [Thozetella sp. PMI_491]